MIWFNPYNLEQVNKFNKNTLCEHLEIEVTELGENYIKGTMPVDHRTHQPYGVLHGGASCVLAESLGSIGSNLIVDPSAQYCVGQTISASHLRPISSGIVEGTATIIHKGRKSHLWEIAITNAEGKLICKSTLTMAVVDKN